MKLMVHVSAFQNFQSFILTYYLTYTHPNQALLKKLVLTQLLVRFLVTGETALPLSAIPCNTGMNIFLWKVLSLSLWINLRSSVELKPSNGEPAFINERITDAFACRVLTTLPLPMVNL